MVWQATPWADPLLASTVVSASLAVFGLLYVWLIRRDRRVVAFVFLMVGAAIWTLGYSFQFASASLAGKLRWRTVSVVGSAIVPAAWLTFALAYSRRDEWLTPARLLALWTVPILTILLAASNGLHGLVWETSRLVDAPDAGYLLLDQTAGPWLWVHGGYSYLASFASIAAVVGLIERSRHVYRGQALVLFAGVFAPVAAHVVSLLGVGPTRVVDLTPPSVAFLGIAFAVGIFRYRLFDLVPVARASLLENMSEGYVLLDSDRDLVDLNAAARMLLDGESGRLIGRDARDAFGVDLSVLDEFERTGQVTETITTGEGSDRQYIELIVSAVETDRVRGTLVTVRDVTDRIQLERRFRTLIERSSDIVFVLDEEGVIEYVSPSVERVLGYDPDDLVDAVSFEALLVEESDRTDRTESTGTSDDTSGDSPTALETWNSLLDGHEEERADDATRFEVRVESASGEPRVIEALARYLVDDPAVEGIVINAREVTERTERERQLQRTNERLDRFASVISHDLRNPLNAAMGFLEVARETEDLGHLDRVHDSHVRMQSMIDELLTMARADTAVENTEAVLVETLAVNAWETADTGDSTLRTDLPSDWTVRSDPGLLRNIFENLFRNASEHNESAVTVTVGRLTDGDESPLGFYVEDDGTGISPDERNQVFEHGYSTDTDGTGFGLSIVTEFVEAHGWTVDVCESSEGGARFEIRTDDGTADLTEDGPPQQAEDEPPEWTETLGPEGR